MVHEGQLTEMSEVRTGVHEAEMPADTLPVPPAYRLVNWIIRSVTNQKRNVIQWTLLP